MILPKTLNMVIYLKCLKMLPFYFVTDCIPKSYAKNRNLKTLVIII